METVRILVKVLMGILLVLITVLFRPDVSIVIRVLILLLIRLQDRVLVGRDLMLGLVGVSLVR